MLERLAQGELTHEQLFILGPLSEMDFIVKLHSSVYSNHHHERRLLAIGFVLYRDFDHVCGSD